MLSLALPSFVVFKSNYNSKYLCCINEEGKMHQFLQFSEEQIVSPYAKYEIEMAKQTSEKGLVHIRCCYSNKYWTLRSWNQRQWIVAGTADGGCENTLFKPELTNNGDTKEVRFRHVLSKSYVRLWISSAHASACLYLASETPQEDKCDTFTIIDWESLLILPKYVAFKSNNGSYLSARWIEKHPYLKFASKDIGDPTISNEVFPTSDGSVRIKSNCFGKFWRRSPNWIWADSDDTTSNNSDTLFWPIKVDDNVVALRNFGNNLFCKSLTCEGKVDCLNAAISSISKDAHLEVHELVISRNIFNVDFRLMDARIYNQRVLTMISEESINHTHEPNTVDIKLSYAKTESSTWNTSISVKLGVKTQILTGVPFIADGKIEVSTEYSRAHQWGETNSSTTTLESTHRAIVPPMSKVRLRLLATKGSFDVPFSYSQRDTLLDGRQVTYRMDDGVYTGSDCFNFKYETKQEKL